MEKALETLATGDRSRVLIQKLGVYDDRIAPEHRHKLAVALARRSDLIPQSHPDDSLFGVGSLPEAANLLRRLVAGIQDLGNRDGTAQKVAAHINQLPLAYEFYRRIQKLKKDHGSEEYVAVISDDCEREVGRIVAQKLALAAQSEPLENSHPLWKRPFYIHWRWHDQASLQAYAKARLSDHPDDVGKFLSAILGLSETEDSDFVPIQDQDGEVRFISDIIDPKDLMAVINSVYPEPEVGRPPRSVRWFLGVHGRGGYKAETEVTEES